MANLVSYDPGVVVEAVLSIGLAFVVLSTSLFCLGYWRAADAPRLIRSRRMLIVALTLPFNWLLKWAADIRAIVQTHRGRFGWEHIDHHGRNFTRGGRPSTVTRSSTVLPSKYRQATLAGIIFVGASLRLAHLDAMGLWVDEIYSIAIRGQLSPSASLVVPDDPHPPLYYIVLHGWMVVFGESAGSARALSAVSSIATIPALYVFGRELFDDRVGLIAAGLLAISTYHVHFGRTARMYSLFGLLTVGSYIFSIGYVRIRQSTSPGTSL